MSTSSPAFSREELLNAKTALVTQRRRVRFQDVDAASMIYFARVLEYFSGRGPIRMYYERNGTVLITDFRIS